jgi:hypothetical protein
MAGIGPKKVCFELFKVRLTGSRESNGPKRFRHQRDSLWEDLDRIFRSCCLWLSENKSLFGQKGFLSFIAIVLQIY